MQKEKGCKSLCFLQPRSAECDAPTQNSSEQKKVGNILYPNTDINTDEPT